MEVHDLRHQPVNILLVEDDDGDAKAVVRAFRKAKLANPVIRAFDGVEALDILQGRDPNQSIKRPYILLVDLNMPRMGGIELIERLRDDEHLNQDIVFVLTTSKRDEDIVGAYERHVAGYITKEKAGLDFLNLIELLDYYWKVVELPV